MYTPVSDSRYVLASNSSKLILFTPMFSTSFGSVAMQLSARTVLAKTGRPGVKPARKSEGLKIVSGKLVQGVPHVRVLRSGSITAGASRGYLEHSVCRAGSGRIRRKSASGRRRGAPEATSLAASRKRLRRPDARGDSAATEPRPILHGGRRTALVPR